MKIWRSKYVWSMKKERETSRSQSMCWRSNSTFCLTKTSSFYKDGQYFEMNANFIYFTSWTMQTCFSGYAHISQEIWLNFTQEIKKCSKLQEYELKLKIWSLHGEALIETIKVDIWNTWFEARWGCRDILKMLQSAKPEVPVWKAGGSSFHGSDLNLSQDFHRIWLGFFDSWKWLCPVTYIYVDHGLL
jgi:hypothetical protein